MKREFLFYEWRIFYSKNKKEMEKVIFMFKNNGLKIPKDLVSNFHVLQDMHDREDFVNPNIVVNKSALVDLSRLFIKNTQSVEEYIESLTLERLKDLSATLNILGDIKDAQEIDEHIAFREEKILQLQRENRNMSVEEADDVAEILI